MRDLDKDGLDGALEASSTITAAIPAPPLVLRPELITPLGEAAAPPRRPSPWLMMAGVAGVGFALGALLFVVARPLLGSTPATGSVAKGDVAAKALELPAPKAPIPPPAPVAAPPPPAAIPAIAAAPAGAATTPAAPGATPTPAPPEALPAPAIAKAAPSTAPPSPAPTPAAPPAVAPTPPSAAAAVSPPKTPEPDRKSTAIGKSWSVHFGWDSSTADAASLRQISKEAATCSGTLVVAGYTCDIGDSDYNLALSRARAQTVSDALKGAGFPDARLRVEPHGEDNQGSRRNNRRVDIRCTNN